MSKEIYMYAHYIIGIKTGKDSIHELKMCNPSPCMEINFTQMCFMAPLSDPLQGASNSDVYKQIVVRKLDSDCIFFVF